MVKRTNNTAREARQRALVAGALSRLAADAPLTGAALFGDEWGKHPGSWPRVFLRRLVADGLLTAERAFTGRRRENLYSPADGVNLDAYLEDPGRLVALIWPSQAPHQPAISGEDEEDAAPNPAAVGAELTDRLEALGVLPDDEEARLGVLEAVADAVAALLALRASRAPRSGAGARHEVPPPDEVLAAVLRLASATAENMIYIRERVDALVADVDALKKAWE